MVGAMRSTRVIHTVSAHAGGEVGDVIVGGVAPPPGATLWEMRDWIARDGRLRNLMLNEPRGGVSRHVNLLVPPVHPEADAAFVIMEPMHTPPMSGSNSICVATVVLETGIVPMREPVTELALEAPGGLVRVRAECAGGAVRRVTVRNMASFAAERGAALEVEGLGTLQVDTAFGGDSFVVVDAEALGFAVEASEAADLARLGARIVAAANVQVGFTHPELPGWNHVSFCLFAGPLAEEDGALTGRQAVAIEPGRIDRSPTGTAVSARMALLRADGRMGVGDRLRARSIIGSEFEGRIAEAAEVGGIPAIVPEISGRAFLTGTHQHMVDPEDPWPGGYRVGDTWPGA